MTPQELKAFRVLNSGYPPWGGAADALNTCLDEIERQSEELAAKDRQLVGYATWVQSLQVVLESSAGKLSLLESENAALRSQLAAVSPVVLDTGKMGE